MPEEKRTGKPIEPKIKEESVRSKPKTIRTRQRIVRKVSAKTGRAVTGAARKTKDAVKGIARTPETQYQSEQGKPEQYAIEKIQPGERIVEAGRTVGRAGSTVIRSGYRLTRWQANRIKAKRASRAIAETGARTPDLTINERVRSAVRSSEGLEKLVDSINKAPLDRSRASRKRGSRSSSVKEKPDQSQGNSGAEVCSRKKNESPRSKPPVAKDKTLSTAKKDQNAISDKPEIRTRGTQKPLDALSPGSKDTLPPTTVRRREAAKVVDVNPSVTNKPSSQLNLTPESTARIKGHIKQPKREIFNVRQPMSLKEVPSRLHIAKPGRAVHTATKDAIKTGNAAQRMTAKTMRIQARAVKKTGAKATHKVTSMAKKYADKATRHMAKLAAKASAKMAQALSRAAAFSFKAALSALQGLFGAIASGGWIAVILIILLCMGASILASPFGIFAHTDNVEYGKYTLAQAITKVNDEYVAQINRMARGADDVHIYIYGNQEGDWQPYNWVDVLAVFAVNTTMREDNPMDIIELDETRLKELSQVFWDMNTLREYDETEDGETTRYIDGDSKSYQEMIVQYRFDDNQKELVEELMSDKWYGMWANYVDFAYGYEGNDWGGVVTVPDGQGMKIPILYQFDYKKTVCKINGVPKSVSTSGCGATSMSMVIRYLTGNTQQTPYTLFKWAYDNGYYSGDGLGHDCLTKLGSLHGVKGSWGGGGTNGRRIINALQSGKPVIAHMGPGIFTKGGHYIVLRGVTEDGKILVNDPNSKKLTKQAFPLSTILKQAKTSSPFMVCEKSS